MKKLIVSIVISMLLSALSIPAFAYKSTEMFMDLSNEIAIVVVWQVKSFTGHNEGFVACGPVQRCTVFLRKTREKAMQHTYYDDEEFARYVGNIGEYEVYSLDRKLKSYDFNARECME